MEHYILKGVTDALFLDFETTTLGLPSKTNAGVTPRGVAYTLRSVLRGSSILNAHFTGVQYSPTWVFLCLFIGKVVVDLEIEQAEASTHAFLYVVINKKRTI